MDFLKRVVPPILSGDMTLEMGDSIQESSPLLLKMKRLSLVPPEKTADEPAGACFRHSHEKCRHQQLGKVELRYFESWQKVF